MTWDKAILAMQDEWRVKRSNGPELQIALGVIMSKQPNGSWDDYRASTVDRMARDWLIVGKKEYQAWPTP